MSANLNSVLLDGNLTRDPELRETSKGTSVCHFGLASNRYYEVNDEKVEEVSFFDVESWSKLAEACDKHLSKGRGIRVIGRLKQDRWQDKEGQNRSRVKVVADHIVFKPKISRNEASQADSEKEIENGKEYDLLEAEEREAAML
ncbi:single-stranded DNA-binding protein [Salinispira pacifica]|uniref:Single-stranded DNA-binding protein n=1 Tax=Salinispira pacifica TaxID=1307761 RepID=V5WCX2_9SPIO|nr:single-stranded DNA-binding protein [Salinispira pacifica]AHC13637.1 Single-stranded DNA-binding protein [Salinispira pacifica]